MKIWAACIFSIVFLISELSVARTSANPSTAKNLLFQAKIKEAVTGFYARRTDFAQRMFSIKTMDQGVLDQDCGNRSSKTCADAVCAHLGNYNCDDPSEINRVAEMCRGNHTGACVESVCTELGSYNCDDFSEMERVTQLCRGQFGGKCIDTACKYLGTYNCDDFSDLERVGKACQGVDGNCIVSVCQRIGAYNCDDFSEIEQVAASCRGN